jgi:flavin reductase (DIM6/NTAB) family NADH-FMN oxidoreductase RutF
MKSKKALGATNGLFPMLTVLVGASVNGLPNFATVGNVGLLTPKGVVSIGLAASRHTGSGIRDHGTFSINLPPEGLLAETDYCGIVSGADTDKASLFSLFYGETPTAPLIVECPINMVCRVIDTLAFDGTEVFVGEIVETFCDEDVLVHGGLDAEKIKPILFDLNSRSYFGLGKRLGPGWRIGRTLRRPTGPLS